MSSVTPDANPANLADAPAERDAAIRLYRWMRLSREIEGQESRMIGRGAGHFHICCGGHEAMAALGEFLTPADWLHCHYRDRALMLARGLTPTDFLNALIGNAHSNSAGRQLSTMHSSPALHLLSMPVSVGNNLLPSVGIAAEVKDAEGAPLVYCGLGDGGTQQGDFFEAVAEAVRSHLPVLFLVQDNNYALSTLTAGKTFYSLPDGPQSTFYGLPIVEMSGLKPMECRARFAELVANIRHTRGPALALMRTERLGDHSNADDQMRYRTEADVARIREHSDPLADMVAQLSELGLSVDEIAAIDAEIAAEVKAAADIATAAPAPELASDVSRPYSQAMIERPEAIGEPGQGRVTMREAIRDTLQQALQQDDAVSLLGQDIEDPKGDIFGVTEGLSTAFPGRVVNAPLAEATIIGTSIGRAMAGGRPIAFLQFADFFPVAYNLFHSELATMYWRSKGDWECPVILMVSCGGYRAGTGPFHTQTMEAVAAHSPGVDVFMPSTPAEAAGMLNAALESRRPTVFLYPKNLINDRTWGATETVASSWVMPGKARLLRQGNDVTLVGWGNTVPPCREAADLLEQFGFSAGVIDLRSISPWDRELVLAEAQRTGRLIVAHEDSLSFGVGAEICATVGEQAKRPVRMRRVARPDTYLPYHFEGQLALLPSARSILEAAAELLDIEIGWKTEAPADASVLTVEATGPSASDDSVTVVEWMVNEGDQVAQDDILAVVEADKAAAEVLAPQAGLVDKLLLPIGEQVKVGTPLVNLRLLAPAEGGKKAPETPFLRQPAKPAPVLETFGQLDTRPMALVGLASTMGGRSMTNEELLKAYPDREHEEVVRLSGIHSRQWLAEGETILGLSVSACQKLFTQLGIEQPQPDMVICSTTTPDIMSPSLACRILREVAGEHECPAMDVSAACSGYLYALRIAADFLRANPAARVLVVTAETFSPMVADSEFDTGILFGDAATASWIAGPAVESPAMLKVYAPVISAQGETGESLKVPLCHSGQPLEMKGGRVFNKAVRKMSAMLHQACEEHDVPIETLEAIIPHQANDRILEAIARHLKLPSERVWRHISHSGNTSSCTIPLCLQAGMSRLVPGARYAMTAFGGGYTYGAALAEVPKSD